AAGVMVFVPGPGRALLQVPATGGAVTAATTLGPQQAGHYLPHFLPDGRRFLLHVDSSSAEESGMIYLGSLDNSTVTRLTPATGRGVYLPSGWLLWLNEGRLVAQRLDPEQGVLTGEPVTVADRVGAVSVAASGLVAYRTVGESPRQLVWLDRAGAVLGPVGDPDGTISNPRVAPDGHRVSLVRTVAGNTDIWLQDGARTSRLTFDAALDNFPIWSPDGSRILFASARSGTLDIYQTLASGAGEPERIVASQQLKAPFSWSADGRFGLYLSIDPQTGADLWVVPMAGEQTPQVFLQTPFYESWGVFSPDGRWVAYQSNGSGRWEIYLRPFVPPGSTDREAAGQWQVSTAGGIHPVWRADGEELYYLNPEGAMVAVPVNVGGSTPELGNPESLFSTRILGGGVGAAAQGRQYDVSADGRFLINTELEGTEAPITLIQNWNQEVAQ
ncbi:MAG TPA: hypothetical protein VJ417_05390, partial [Candidatus Glassbacteria bacterium]|nr:hypothetical protein [Candidatus Glassbacteria bacterium]